MSLVGYVISYVLMAELSRRLSYANLFSPLWLPVGFSVGVMAYSTRRRWPFWASGLVSASLVYNGWMQGKSFGVVFGFTVSNLFCEVFAAWLIQTWLPGRFRLREVRDVLVFVCVACLVAPALSSLIGSVPLSLAYGTDIRAS